MVKAEGSIVAVILAGGLGKRMRPLTHSLPKPMLPVAGKPVIEWQVELLKRHGITDIVICGYYLIDKIKNHLGDGSRYGVRIRYSVESKPLGSGGAIKNAQELIGSRDFVAMSGDIVTNIIFSSLIKFHYGKKSFATVVVRKTEHPEDSDLVVLDDNCRITEFFPKSGQKKGSIGVTGISFLSNRALAKMEKKPHSFESEFVSKLIKNETVFGYMTDEYIRDMGTHRRYEKVNKEFGKFTF